MLLVHGPAVVLADAQNVPVRHRKPQNATCLLTTVIIYPIM